MTNAQLAPYDSPIKKNSDHYKKVIAVKCMPDKALSGTPGTTRTYDLRIRSPLLYPAELQARRILRVGG